ncbi:MAG TPA: phage major capsid protein [Pyrinomonadaceae bacterium]
MKKKLLQRNDKRVIGKKLKRAFALVRESLQIDEKARTVEPIAFSSDTPVEHWFGRLILDHSPSSVRLDRLRQNGPFLTDHDRTKQIGVHENVSNDGHICRAKIRFSKRSSAEEEFQDVIDGIRTGISSGFIVHELHLEREDDDGPIYRSTDWEPVENSLVSIPADLTVGVGRSMDDAEDVCEACEGEGCEECQEEERAGDKEDYDPEEEEDPDAAAEEDEERNKQGGARAAHKPTTEARKVMERDEELLALGEMLGEVELAREFIADETMTVADFRKEVREKHRAAKAKTPTEDPATVAARSGGHVQLTTRAIGGLKAFRGEGAAEKAYRFGMFLLAGPMARVCNEQLLSRAQTFCRENGIVIKRAHSESDNESGGVLVPTEFEAVMIDLREQFGVFRRFANVVPMSTDSKQRPRRKGGLTAYPIGAKGSSRRITESKKKWDLVELFARKWGVLAKYEDELSEDSVISMADDLAYEIAYAMTIAEDDCGFLGDGTGDFHGITGVINKIKGLSGTVANVAGLVQASGNTWDSITRGDLLKLVGRLPQYADTPNARFFCHKTFWSEVLVRLILEAGGTTAAEVEGARVKMFNGYQVEIAQVLPKSTAASTIPLLFGDLAKGTMFGDRRGVTIKLTDSNDTDFEEDLWTIKGTERFDINVHDVGNADATPAKREAGPIVALITAP